MTRGSPDRLVILPAALLLKLLLGWPNSGVLVTLKTSQRNSRLTRSMGNSRSRAASKTLVRGPIMVLRPLLPKVPAAGSAYASVRFDANVVHALFLDT